MTGDAFLHRWNNGLGHARRNRGSSLKPDVYNNCSWLPLALFRNEDQNQVMFIYFAVNLHKYHPTASLPAQSFAYISIAPNARPSSATLLSPAESTPSKPAAHSTALPIAHLLNAPAVASSPATPYPQPNKILSASTLFATTAHPSDLAAAGTS